MERPAPAPRTMYRVEVLLDDRRRPVQINGTKLGPQYETLSVVVIPLDPREQLWTWPELSILSELLEDLDRHTGRQPELWDLEDDDDGEYVVLTWSPDLDEPPRGSPAP